MSKCGLYLEDFNYDSETNKIISCPQGNVCIESEFITSKRFYYARFGVEQCSCCNYIKQCPVKLKNRYSVARIFMKSESKRSEKNNNGEFIIEEGGLKYIGESDEVIVPEYIDGALVDKIAPEGFARKRVKRVVLPNTVKTIGRSSFADCSELSNIIIPDSVTNIEAWAFGSCSSLSRIELSDNVIEIGSHAFDQCYKLKYIELPSRIDYIGAYAFSETALKKVVLPRNIKYLANSLFYECQYLKEVILQEGLETIGTWTFGYCTRLSKINLPDSIKVISDASFDNCIGLREISIPESLIEMSETSFNNCFNVTNVETDDIHKKIVVPNIQKRLIENLGLSEVESKYEDEYDTIYNMLLRSIGKSFNVTPIHIDEKSQQQIYEDVLNEGVDLKRKGEYEKAKEKYIEAIRLGCKNPTAYYNLGKILYILGDFEASVRSYQTSFELGIDPYNVLVHLGHALIDKDSKNSKYISEISFYKRGINPHLINEYIDNENNFIEMIHTHPSKESMDEYDNKCIVAAKKYLNL